MAEPHDLLRSSLAGRYDVERELGEGGMATVYLAHDVRHARKVAVKVIRPEAAAALCTARFLAEIRLTASLQHPHILGLIESGLVTTVDGERPFYVMPYVAGETLRPRLARERTLPVNDAVTRRLEDRSALVHLGADGLAAAYAVLGDTARATAAWSTGRTGGTLTFLTRLSIESGLPHDCRPPTLVLMPTRPLGIGFIGSGFNTRFHIQGFQAIRDADVRGVWSPNKKNAASAAALARTLDVGDAKAYPTITDMVADPEIEAIWLCGPNHARIENVEELVHAIESGKGTLKGIACEKPLARNVAEAKKVIELVRRVELPHGYLENQVFTPQVETGKNLLWARGAATTGRPYLARAAEEHSGPHGPWFWRGNLQGGGVLNDMMCHSALVVRHLLTKPGEPYDTVKPVRITGHIASLKWSRPEYAKILSKTMDKGLDYTKTPSEDFANVVIEFETSDGHKVLGEASTSWSFVGAGLRLSAELLGPEYSMSWNTLDSGLKLFFSRQVKGKQGEDLVEKQNAETGLMPVVAGEAMAYGYEAEDRHFARVFQGKEKARLTFDDGLEVVKVLMAAYASAEAGKTLDFPPKGLDKFVPKVAKGEWKP